MVNKKSQDDFEKLLEQYDYKFKNGDLVQGVISGFESNGLLVDIGAKTTAFVPSYEAVEKGENINDKFEKGQKLEFLIIKEEDEDGRFLLSKRKVDSAYAWKELEEAKKNDSIILATITNIVKGGVLVDISSVKGFIPLSQLKATDNELKIGDKIEVKILSLDLANNNLVLSSKKVYDDSISETRKHIFEQVELGQVLKGTVVRITDFGAFVDIGGVDALLPLSQLSWKWIDSPVDILSMGQVIEAQVIEVDKDKQRISLSLKDLEKDPWLEISDKFKEGDKIEGVVTRIKNFGAFVEVYSSVEALLPHKELVDYQNNSNKILEVGSKIDAYISKFNPDDRRISLTVRAIDEE